MNPLAHARASIIYRSRKLWLRWRGGEPWELDRPFYRDVHPTAVVQASSIDFSAKLGPHALIRSAKLEGKIEIGDHSQVRDAWLLGRIRIGRYTTINGPNTDIVSRCHPVTIGNFCSIARNVTIQEFNHNIERVTSYFIFANFFGEQRDDEIVSDGPIEIGSDVWIGAQCVLVAGARIGHGAVIAAHSTVTGPIPPYAIAGGTPARVLHYRFEPPIVSRLLDLAWWDWDDETIRRNRDLFDGPLTADNLARVTLP